MNYSSIPKLLSSEINVTKATPVIIKIPPIQVHFPGTSSTPKAQPIIEPMTGSPIITIDIIRGGIHLRQQLRPVWPINPGPKASKIMKGSQITEVHPRTLEISKPEILVCSTSIDHNIRRNAEMKVIGKAYRKIGIQVLNTRPAKRYPTYVTAPKNARKLPSKDTPLSSPPPIIAIDAPKNPIITPNIFPRSTDFPIIQRPVTITRGWAVTKRRLCVNVVNFNDINQVPR